MDRGLRCAGPDATGMVVAGRDACRRLLLDGAYVFGSPTSVLYRADLVRGRDPFFLELESGYFEDAELCFEVLEQAKFGFIHQILTYTRLDNESSFRSAERFAFKPLSIYIMTKKYGQRYLSDSEFRCCLPRAERDYYGMLASSLFKGRGSGFWRYHTRGFELAGDRLDWGRVVRHAIATLT